MPANKKYLSTPFQRFLKITAGFIGGYVVMISFHVLVTHVFEKKDVVVTISYGQYCSCWPSLQRTDGKYGDYIYSWLQFFRCLIFSTCNWP